MKRLALVLVFLLVASSVWAADSIRERSKIDETVGWSLSGANDDIDASYELITELDSTYAQLAANDNLEVLSADAADITQTITIEGINSAGYRVIEDIALDTDAGTSPVTTTTTFSYVDQVSTDIKCAGAVTVRRATGDTFIVSIPAGMMEATVIQHFNGEKDTYITSWRASVTSTTGTVIFDLRYYPDDASCLTDTVGYKLLDQIVLTNALDTAQNDFAQSIKCPAGGWITIHALGGAANSDGSCTLQGYDVKP